MSMDDDLGLTLTPTQLAEWAAWQDYINEVRKLIPDSIDINGLAFQSMFDAVRRWGEHLVRLRVMQSPEVRIAAFREHDAKYTP